MVISGTQLWQVGLTDLLFKPYVYKGQPIRRELEE